MKTYEITYLTVEEEGNDAQSIATSLNSHGSKIVSVHPWGNRRRLMYPIKKQDQAFFTTVVFESEPSSIAPIQRELHISPEVIRSLIVEFEPGMFHRTQPASDEAVKTKLTEKTVSEIPAESPAAGEESPVSAESTPTEEKAADSTPVEKPKRRRTAKTVATEDKSLDEKLTALLNEDITK